MPTSAPPPLPLFARATWFWLLVLGLPLLLLICVHDILLPFAIGTLAAYFLDPAADRLERLGMSRTVATFIITAIFFIGLGLLLALVAPLLFNQLSELASVLPSYVASLQVRYQPQLRELYSQVGQAKGAGMVSDAVRSLSTSLAAKTALLAAGIVQSGLAVANMFALIFVTPVVAFYLLRDWDVLVGKINALMPRKHARTIRAQLRAIDLVLSGFIRGQTYVCLFLAVFYSISLSLFGLQYGLALGLTVGFLTFIPYVGALFGLALGLLLAFVQYGNALDVSIVGGIFLVGQFLESNIVAPRLVGGRVGLHPVWIIFGLLAGGTLFGFLGVLLAVPVTASAGVLIRYFVGRYKESRYYKA